MQISHPVEQTTDEKILLKTQNEKEIAVFCFAQTRIRNSPGMKSFETHSSIVCMWSGVSVFVFVLFSHRMHLLFTMSSPSYCKYCWNRSCTYILVLEHGCIRLQSKGILNCIKDMHIFDKWTLHVQFHCLQNKWQLENWEVVNDVSSSSPYPRKNRHHKTKSIQTFRQCLPYK